MDPKPLPTKTQADRKAYQHDYYLANREKAIAYQRDYARAHPDRHRSSKTTRYERPQRPSWEKPCYSVAALQHLPPEKFGPAVTAITQGEAALAKAYTHGEDQEIQQFHYAERSCRNLLK